MSKKNVECNPNTKEEDNKTKALELIEEWIRELKKNSERT